MANEKFQKRIDEPFDDDSSKYRRVADEYHTSTGVIVGRILISVLLTVLLAATLMWSLLYTIAHGPSEDYRIKLVTDAAAREYTEWIPYTVLPADEVDRIINQSEVRE